MMWVYIETERNLWTVGFYSPDGLWHGDSDHDNREEAGRRVHYLNGGDEPPEPENPYILHGEELERTTNQRKRGEAR